MHDDDGSSSECRVDGQTTLVSAKSVRGVEKKRREPANSLIKSFVLRRAALARSGGLNTPVSMEKRELKNGKLNSNKKATEEAGNGVTPLNTRNSQTTPKESPKAVTPGTRQSTRIKNANPFASIQLTEKLKKAAKTAGSAKASASPLLSPARPAIMTSDSALPAKPRGQRLQLSAARVADEQSSGRGSREAEGSEKNSSLSPQKRKQPAKRTGRRKKRSKEAEETREANDDSMTTSLSDSTQPEEEEEIGWVEAPAEEEQPTILDFTDDARAPKLKKPRGRPRRIVVQQTEGEEEGEEEGGGAGQSAEDLLSPALASATEESADDVVEEAETGAEGTKKQKGRKGKRGGKADAFSGTTITNNVRNALRGVWESKDERAAESALTALFKTFEIMTSLDVDGNLREVLVIELTFQLNNLLTSEKSNDARQRCLRLLAYFVVRVQREFDDMKMVDYVIFFIKNTAVRLVDVAPRLQAVLLIGLIFEASLLSAEQQSEQERAEKRNKGEKKKKSISNWMAKKTAEEETSEDDKGHILTLKQRRSAYSVLLSQVNDMSEQVRSAVVRACSVIQDDDIPANFSEAIQCSPKDLIIGRLRDVNCDVRLAAMRMLNPTTPEQLEGVVKVAMNDRHEKVRRLALTRLAQNPISEFSMKQRLLLLSLVEDWVMKECVSRTLLLEWMRDLAKKTTEEEMPLESIVGGGPSRKKKKKNGGEVVNWLAAPLLLMKHLDCLGRRDEVATIIKEATQIAGNEAGLEGHGALTWTQVMIEACKGLQLITADDYNNLVRPETKLNLAGLMSLHWLTNLRHLHSIAKDDGDKEQALALLSLHLSAAVDLIFCFLEDERVRRQRRQQMLNRDIEAIFERNHLLARTSPTKIGVLRTLLKALHFIDHSDENGVAKWRDLLLSLACSEQVDLSEALAAEVAADLLKFHDLVCDDDDSIDDTSGLDEMCRRLSALYSQPEGASKSKKGAKGSLLKPVCSEFAEKDDGLILTHAILRTGKIRSEDDRRIRWMIDRFVHPILQEDFSSEVETKPSVDELAPSCTRVERQCLAVRCTGMLGTFSSDYAMKRIAGLARKAREPTEDDTIRAESLLSIVDFAVAHSLRHVNTWLSTIEDPRSHVAGKGFLYCLIQDLTVDNNLDLVHAAAVACAKLCVNQGYVSELSVANAILALRLFHISANRHPSFRDTIIQFFQMYGTLGRKQQIAITNVCIEVLLLMIGGKLPVALGGKRGTKGTPDGPDVVRVLQFLLATCAPSALSESAMKGVEPGLKTAHVIMLDWLLGMIERQQQMDSYIMDLLCEAACCLELTGMNDENLRSMYDRAFEIYETVKVVAKSTSMAVRAMKEIIRNVEASRKYLKRAIEAAEATGSVLSSSDFVLPVGQGVPKRPVKQVRKKPEKDFKKPASRVRPTKSVDIAEEPSTSTSAAASSSATAVPTPGRAHLSRTAKKTVFPRFGHDDYNAK